MEKPEILYLSQADVASVNLPMAEIIKALETAFREKGQGKTEMPPKPGIHPGGGDNFIHAMPAYIPALKSAGLKWVSGFIENHKRGLPYITGLLILNDVETGLPLAVMDCVWITAHAHRCGNGPFRSIPGASGILRGRDSGLRRAGPDQSGGAESSVSGEESHGLRYGFGNRSTIRQRDGVPIRRRGCDCAEAGTKR